LVVARGLKMLTSESLSDFKSLVMLSITAIAILAVFPLLFWNTNFSMAYLIILTPLTSFFAFLFLFYTTWWSYKNQRDIFKSWLLLAIGMGFYVTANMFYFIFKDVLNVISYPSIADILYLFAYPLLLVGIILFANKPFKIRYKNLLDVIIIMASSFFIVWFLFIWPIVEPSRPDTISLLLSISYLFLDLVVLFVVLTLIFNENRKISELPLIFLSLGFFFQVFGDMIYAYNAVNPSLFYHWSYTILYTSNCIFIIVGIISFLKNINIDFGRLRLTYTTFRDSNFWISYLPLILVLFTYGLLIITTPDAALIWGVGIIVALVILREVISLNEIKKAQIILKKNKELIANKEEQLSFITTNMVDLITESNSEGIYRYVSRSSYQLLGIFPENLLGKSFYDFVHHQDLEKVISDLKKAEKSHSSVRLRYRFRNVEEAYIWMETIGKPIYKDNKFKGFIYSSRDVTEQINAEEFVKNSLKEKEILLREIHHRVNNNLQVIISLLSLQSRNVVNEEDQILFKESQNRVRTMAMIHEKLYQSKNLSSINFSEYLKTLMETLIYDQDYYSSHIKVDLDVEDINFNIETSVPCGLIINELVSNSLKHAFPPGTNGNITIKMHHLDDMYELIVADDGVGYHWAIDKPDGGKFGLELVKSLVGQLDGTIELIDGKGTAYRILFNELEYTSRI
jgi:two-component system, sensor histidine kinase PdtaS